MKLTHFRSVALELQRQLGLPISKAYLRLHTAVFLWGFTAILGRLISIEELPLVLWRVFLTSLSLLFFRAVRRELAGFSLKKALPFMAIGCVVALHWVCFFGSVKYSNVSITLVCAATASFMTSFLEPLLTGRKFRPYEAGLGVAVIPAMLLIAQSSGKYDTGVVLGLISAFLAALFTTLNKKFMGEGNSQYITFIELSSGTVLLALLAPLYLTLFPAGNISYRSKRWATACTISLSRYYYTFCTCIRSFARAFSLCGYFNS